MRMGGLILVVALAGCGEQAPSPDNKVANERVATADQTASATPAAFAEQEYLGRWRGVEGMYLLISKAEAGGYRLEMQWDLDHHGTFTAQPAGSGLSFTRDGRTLLLRRTDGDATGLKYLAGKKDCLTVAPGEGYCRN